MDNTMLNMKQPLWERRCPYAKLIVAFFIGRREGGKGRRGRKEERIILKEEGEGKQGRS